MKWLALSSVALGLLVAGCNGGSSSTTSSGESGGSTAMGGETVKIGLVASLNGDLRPWGIDSQSGAQLAVNEINAAGGINGKKIELMIEDSGSKPDQGKTAAERLISKGASVIVGEVASGITAQIAGAAAEKKIPVIAVGATKTQLPGIGEYVFRVCYTDDLQGPVMANFAYDELGLRNVALMTDKKQPYSVYLSQTFSATFKNLGGKIVDEQFYESGQTQFSGVLTQVKAKSPDGLFLSGYFTEVGPIARQAKEAGLDGVKFMGGDGWDSSEILTSGGDAILGSYFCNHYNNKEDRPEVKTFLEKWDKTYKGIPGTTMGALAYDATNLAADAIKRAKDSSKAADIVTALSETENFPGVSGLITLKGMGGNPPKRALVVQLTKDGQVFAKAYEAKDVKK